MEVATWEGRGPRLLHCWGWGTDGAWQGLEGSQLKGSGQLSEMRRGSGRGRWLRLSPPSHYGTQLRATSGLNMQGQRVQPCPGLSALPRCHPSVLDLPSRATEATSPGSARAGLDPASSLHRWECGLRPREDHPPPPPPSAHMGSVAGATTSAPCHKHTT